MGIVELERFETRVKPGGGLNLTMLEARKGWTLYAAMIARIFLASTLLLNACTLIFRDAARTNLITLVELLLGVFIAVGWGTRYAAGLVLVGTLATRLWVIPLRMALLGSRSAVLASIVSSGILICFGRKGGLVCKAQSLALLGAHQGRMKERTARRTY